MAKKANIGAGISLSGEREFKNAIRDINKDLGVLGSEMKKVTTQFAGNKNSVEALTKKDEVLNKQLVVQKDKIEEIKKALENSKTQYGENDNKTKEWQRTLNNAEADLNKLNNELDENKKALNNAKNPISKFSTNIKKAGSNAAATSTKINNLSKKAAAMGKAFAIGAGAAAVALYKISSNTGKFADDLITLSNKTGVTTTQLQELGYASRFVDVEVETMTSSIFKMTSRMDDARKGLKDQKEAFEKLGIEVENADGTLRDANQVFFEVVGALGEMDNSTEANAIAMDLFGRSAQELNPLIEAGAENLKGFIEQAHELGIVINEEDIIAMGAFDDKMQTINALFETAGRQLGLVLMPYLEDLANFVIENMPEIKQKVQDFADKVVEIVDWIKLHSDGLKDALKGLLLAFLALKGISVATGALALFGLTIGAPLVGALALVAALTLSLVLFKDEWKKVGDAIKKVTDRLDAWIEKVKKAQKQQPHSSFFSTGTNADLDKNSDKGFLYNNSKYINEKYDTKLTDFDLQRVLGFATGTVNASSGYHLVGENGIELMKFSGGEQVLNNSDTKKLLSGAGATVNQNIYFMQPEATLFDIYRQTKKASDAALSGVFV